MSSVYKKVLKFKDKDGKLHSYVATIVNGFISEYDFLMIQKIKRGEV
ncbi:MAG: hypothetical protein J6S85_19415 [Methanobrevibacter sp.]|nr:hypothetical protein [Methanobrevibacter sp.]